MDSTERSGVPVAMTRRLWELIRALFGDRTTAPNQPAPTAEPSPEPPVLDLDYFKPVLELLNGTTQSAFVTGKAGTGKSTFLRYFVGNTRKRLVVLAPTGLAALNVKGQTIHAFFKFKPGLLTPDDLPLNPLRAHLYRAVDALIIDEVSMVRVDLMNAIDLSLRRHRGNNEPFGGVQLILIGDLFQLPPVTPNQLAEYCDKQYGGPYFFNAPVFATGFNLACFELSRVMRQQSRAFIDLLGRVRTADQTDEDLIQLHGRHIAVAGPAPDAAVVLTTTNALASRTNRAELAALQGAEATHEAVLSDSLKDTCDQLLLKHQGNPDQLERALETSFPTSVKLTLKPGAKIIMIKNDTQKRWVSRQSILATPPCPRFRIDFGRLLDWVSEDRTLADVYLVGSRPPEVDTLSKVLPAKGIRPKIFERHGGREKGADHDLVAEMIEASILKEKVDGVIARVAGDGDYRSIRSARR